MLFNALFMIGWCHCSLLCCPEWPFEGRQDPPGPGGRHGIHARGGKQIQHPGSPILVLPFPIISSHASALTQCDIIGIV